MIIGLLNQGSGLGNQLHRIVATKILALDKGYDWGMVYIPDGSGKDEGFKGKSFMHPDLVRMTSFNDNIFHDDLTGTTYPLRWLEKKVIENGVDIRSYDPEFNFIEDNTIVEGEFQDERYWAHREKEVDEWLKVEPLAVPDDVCVIGFRGGEYSIFPDLFLPKEYWAEAIVLMLQKNVNMKFEVHTDDPELARHFFPDYKIVHDIGVNWRAMRYAKYAIIANSSFYILPRWLRNGYTIAPRYWARHNTKVWGLMQNYYPRFKYI